MVCQEDLDPAYTGDMELVDREDGRRMTVSITEEVTRDYRERVARWREQVAGAVISSGGAYVMVDSRADLEDLLLREWRKAGVLR
jgi:hypothetical protein